MTDDQALVRQILQGNLRAYQTLVERYQRLVLHMISRIIQHPEVVEDVCQEVFIKVYRHLASYQADARLSTWIASIAYRTAINYLKKYHTAQETPLTEWQTDIDSGDRNPEELLMDQDQHTMLHRQIARLPVQYRTVLTLYHLEDMSYGEIGEIMNMPEGTVKNYLFRARKRLKEALEPYKNERKQL